MARPMPARTRRREVGAMLAPPAQRCRDDVGQDPGGERRPSVARQVGRSQRKGHPPAVESDATVARAQLELVTEHRHEIVQQIAADRRVEAMTAEVDALTVHGDRPRQPADAVRTIDDPNRVAAPRAAYSAAASPAGPAPSTATSTSESDD